MIARLSNHRMIKYSRLFVVVLNESLMVQSIILIRVSYDKFDNLITYHGN